MIVSPGQHFEPGDLAAELARIAAAVGIPGPAASYADLFAAVAKAAPQSRSLNPCGQVAGGLFGPGNTCAAGESTPGVDSSRPDVPPEPGKSPVPPGHVRLYHYTNAGEGSTPAEEQAIVDSLATHGIDKSKARGETYGEGNAVWASTARPDDGKVFVEFSVPWNDPRMYPKIESPDLVAEAERMGHNYRFFQSIKPSEFVAIHRPFHHHVRYIRENADVLSETLSGENDFIIKSGRATGQAVEFVKTHGRSLNPCGQVAGGLFGPGNTCAASDGDAGGGGAAAPAPEGMPDSAANCPPVCEMLAPIADGGTLKVPANDAQFVDAVDWQAAEEADGEVLEAIRAYTGDGYEAANEAARAGNLDHVLTSGSGSLDDEDPDDILQNYGDSDYIPITDSDALETINDGKETLTIWKSALSSAGQTYDGILARMVTGSGDLRGEIIDIKDFPKAFDPSLEYTSVKPTPDDPHEEGTIYLPGMTDHEREGLNMVAESIRGYSDNFEVEDPEGLTEKLDSLVADNSPSWIGGFKPHKEYIDYDQALEWAFSSARDSGNYDSGSSLESLDVGLRQIGENANVDGPIASWRSTGHGAKELADGLLPGDIFSGEGFLSTSASPKFAVDWKGSGIKTLWRFVGSSGAPIDRISSARGEREVLYPHTASFRVANVAKDVTIERNSGETFPGVTVVDLVETEDE